MSSGGVLITDDHKVLRQGLRCLLQREGFDVVAEAEDGRNAVKLAKTLKPSAVVMDIAMPRLNGIEATKQICREAPNTKVIVMSMHRERQFVLGAFKAGAAGYLLKEAAFDELVLALRSVAKNHTYLSPAVAGVVVRAYVKPQPANKKSLHHNTSSREQEVLQLLVEGKSTKEIAATLYVSVKTIETHRKRIMDKLNIHSVAELTKYAIREGVTCA
jgi:two-component system response regulator NreC